MVIRDRIYGRVKINDPLILEIIKSSSFQRLKKISQFGPPDEFYHLKNFYRDEHSLGVMILLQKLGASREEQIAGLLHDISHTAFSHTIDWAIGSGGKEDFQDKQHKIFLKTSEIPTILKKFGINPKTIYNYKNFKLLEREIPDLCADRIDYSLREFPKKIAKICFNNLTTVDNQIVFKNQSSAYLFASNFLKTQQNHWGGFEATSRYKIFGDLLKKALEKKIIVMDDFWKEEKAMIKKIKKSNDYEIKRLIKILQQKSLKSLPKSSEKVYKKFRHVDPYFLKSGKLYRLNKENKKFAKELEIARRNNKKGILVPAV